MEEVMTSTITENEDTNIVTFMSYNSTGLNNIKTNWVNEVCELEQIDYFPYKNISRIIKILNDF